MDNNTGNKTFKSYYLDNDHNIVSREEATNAVINVFDESGNMVEEIWESLRNPWEGLNYNEIESEMTPEMAEIMRNIQDKNGNYIFRELVDKELAASGNHKKRIKKYIKKLFCRKR